MRKFVIEEIVRTVLVEYVEKVNYDLIQAILLGCKFFCVCVNQLIDFLIADVLFFSVVAVVEQEGIKAKKSLATDKTADELNTVFEPGQDFGFDATLDLEEDSGDAEAKAEPAESEVVSA